MDYKKLIGDANESFLSFNGDDSLDFTDEMYADGGAESRSVVPSQPYIINIANTLGTDTTITLFDSADSIAGGAPSFGNAAGVTITSGVSGVSYSQILFNLMQQPFKVGRVDIFCSNTSQLTEGLVVVQNNLRGKSETNQFFPELNPLQNIQTQIQNGFKFSVNNLTKFQFTLLGGVTNISLRFYPESIFSSTKTVAGLDPVVGYGAPKNMANYGQILLK